MDRVDAPVAPLGTGNAATGNQGELRRAAEGLEAAFLSEMLKAAKFGEPPSAFGGGIGEEQFASFLRDAQAKEMVRAGGIGLAEQIYRSMAARGARDE